MTMLSEFYQKELDQIDLAINLVEAEEFVSRAEIEVKREENFRAQKTEELLSSPLVIEAKEIFGGQIDRVILADEKK